MSSFTQAVTSSEPADGMEITGTRLTQPLDTPTQEEIQDNISLMEELRVETALQTSSLEILPSTPQVSIYQNWECAFGFKSGPVTSSSAPSSRDEFMKVVREELTRINSVRIGLSKYKEAINSGEHTVFPQDFLNKQNRATDVTIGQLDNVEEHLNEALGHGTEDKVKDEPRKVYSDAKPWIARTRAIMVHSHVFYKINYALAADKRKEK